MEEKSTLARPYATAVFKIAEESGDFESWSEMLAFLASVVRDPLMQRKISDRRIDRARVGQLVLEIAGGRLTEKAGNLVRVLSENGRLGLMDAIAERYEAVRAEAETRQKVQVISAFAVNPKFKTAIAEALSKRLGCEVDLETEVDRSLIGGIVIRAGDLVIDASLRGRLRDLAGTLA